MRALVTGGAGFIGSHLCDALIARDDTVVCVDDLSRGRMDNITHLGELEKFTFYQKDISCIRTLQEIFKKERPEYVFHLVANSDIQESAKNPEMEYRCTYSTTFNVLQCMREYNVRQLFFASTSAVYGDKKDTILDENTPGLSPVSYYGAAKLGCEALISAFSYMNDMEALVFRFPNVIGPRLTHGVVYDFIKKLKTNQTELEILGNGQQTKPYVYVLDLIRAIIGMINRGQKGVSLYNLGVDSATSVTKIADILCEEMGLENVKYCYTGGDSGWKGDVPRFQYCLDKIHRTGWRAEFDSDEAVRMAIRCALEQ